MSFFFFLRYSQEHLDSCHLVGVTVITVEPPFPHLPAPTGAPLSWSLGGSQLCHCSHSPTPASGRMWGEAVRVCHLCTGSHLISRSEIVKGTMTIHDALEKMDFCGSYRISGRLLSLPTCLEGRLHILCKPSQWFPNLSTYCESLRALKILKPRPVKSPSLQMESGICSPEASSVCVCVGGRVAKVLPSWTWKAHGAIS